MKHDVLGEVELSDGHPFDATVVVRYDSREIRFGLIRDDQPLETTLALAATVVRRLGELDRQAKSIAAADLCAAYNDGWNKYDEGQDDGSFKTVTNPQLSAAEFEAKLSLWAVNVTGAGMLNFHYDDERMFWGHAVIVTSMNGVDLREAHAEMFG
ncbi:MAG: DUF2262 domain-containing protein [Gemmataceae bacterium]